MAAAHCLLRHGPHDIIDVCCLYCHVLVLPKAERLPAYLDDVIVALRRYLPGFAVARCRRRVVELKSLYDLHRLPYRFLSPESAGQISQNILPSRWLRFSL